MGKLKEALAAVTADCKEAKSEMAKLASSMAEMEGATTSTADAVEQVRLGMQCRTG